MTIKKDEFGWIEIAGGATNLNPRYWESLNQSQRKQLLSITKEEMGKVCAEFDTVQREGYIDFRAEGDDHKTAMAKASDI